MLRVLTILLLLFTSWVSADGWFDDLRMELRAQHADIVEVKGLLSTLVPDVEFELVGSELVARGGSDALEQVRELFYELDRPLDNINLDVRAFNFIDGRAQLFRENPSTVFWLEKSRGERTGRSDLWSSVPFNPAHYDPSLPILTKTGQAKLESKRHILGYAPVEMKLDFPGDIEDALFERNGVRFRILAEKMSEAGLLVKFRARSGPKTWFHKVEIVDGDTIAIGRLGQDKVVFVTFSLMRSSR